MRRVEIDRLPDLAAELVRLKVDIIVTAADSRYSRCQESNQQQFPSLWRLLAIQWEVGSSPAWRGPAATSRDCRK